MSRGWRLFGLTLGIAAGVALAGCASAPSRDTRDPLEPLNRQIFQFNDAVDAAVLKPVAVAYRDYTPVKVRHGINNFLGNLEDAWSVVNNGLQFKARPTLDSLMRVGINTTMGIVGLFDVASEMSIERHTKDFGHTLGYWGVPPGPFLILPLLGPSSVRDAVALPVDWQGNLVNQLDHVPTRNSAAVLKAVDDRSSLLKATSMLEDVALDRYTFTRDAYLQRRRNDIFDGNPPEEEPAPDSLAQ